MPERDGVQQCLSCLTPRAAQPCARAVRDESVLSKDAWGAVANPIGCMDEWDLNPTLAKISGRPSRMQMLTWLMRSTHSRD